MATKRPLKKIIFEGKPWCSQADAARYLGMTTAKIKQLMGCGALAWTQIRINGPLIVSTEDLAKVKYSNEPDSGRAQSP
jgi:hypothetical protein